MWVDIPFARIILVNMVWRWDLVEEHFINQSTRGAIPGIPHHSFGGAGMDSATLKTYRAHCVWHLLERRLCGEEESMAHGLLRITAQVMAVMILAMFLFHVVLVQMEVGKI